MVIQKLQFYSGPGIYEAELQLLLVSTQLDVLQKLQRTIIEVKERDKDKLPIYNLKVNVCSEISDLPLNTTGFHVDYIGFVINPRRSDCMQEIVRNMHHLDEQFPRERICMINLYDKLPGSRTQPIEIWEMTSDFQLNYIIGNNEDDECVRYVASRILTIMQHCCCVNTDVPLIGCV